jgi:hypothetical protein
MLVNNASPKYPGYMPRGINSTPVIDVGANRMYVLFSIKNQFPEWWVCKDHPEQVATLQVAYYLATLDLRSGDLLDEVGPIGATVYRADGQPVEFVAKNQMDHPALLLDRGYLYIAFGESGEGCPQYQYHGWVFRYRTNYLKQEAVFCTSPDSDLAITTSSGGSGVWQGGGGLAADPTDPKRNVYFLTGNGRTDLPDKFKINSPLYPHTFYGDTFVKLTPSGNSINPTAFVPYGAEHLSETDADLGSGGAMLIPDTNLVIGGGKSGLMYLVDRDSMQLRQGFPASTNQYHPFERDQSWNGGPHLHGSPTYWRGPDGTYGNLYVWGEKDFLKLYRFSTKTNKFDESRVPSVPVDAGAGGGATGPAKLEARPERQAKVKALPDTMPGGMLSVSANGNGKNTGIVWATLPASDLTVEWINRPGRLYAFDAQSLDWLWDTGYRSLAHWVPPTIADGKVFIASGFQGLIAYHLCPEGKNCQRPEEAFQPEAYSIRGRLGLPPGEPVGPSVESCKGCHHQGRLLQELLNPRPMNERYPSGASIRGLTFGALQEVTPPQGHLKTLVVAGNGLQTYAATSSPSERGKLVWRLKDTTADLQEVFVPNPAKQPPPPVRVRISPGSVWSALDGSSVVGKVLTTAAAPEATDADWVLFKVIESRGQGILSNVSYIQCASTHAGHAPAIAPKRIGEVAQVPYFAQYWFYSAKTEQVKTAR